MKKRVSTKQMLIITATVIFILGLLIQLAPSRHSPIPDQKGSNQVEQSKEVAVKATEPEPIIIDAQKQPQLHAKQKRLEKHFQQAIVMLHAKRYEMAMVALHQVLAIDPKMPEAHTNMGFALLGNNQPEIAKDFFMTAIDLNEQQLNAYYGLALSHGRQQEYQSAIAAMVSYIHLSPDTEQYLQKAMDYLRQWREIVAAQESQAQQQQADES